MERDNRNFSAHKRIEILEEMSSSNLDILVIGGGITGSGIALEAVSRGLKVGLVEKDDFASGVSSRSGKLIHGGLKYLKQGDLGLVREVGRERTIVHDNAKHLVIPTKMLFPIVKNGSFNKFTLKVGLSTYDKLAGVKKEERHVMLSRKEVFDQEPLLNKELVSGGGMYFEYRTDDSRLTLEVAKTAFESGGLICNYTEVVDFLKDENNKVIGAVVKELTTNKTYNIYSKYVVNASGPWVDKVRRLDGPISGKRLHLAKGIHIVVPFNRLPVNESIYFDVAGRMIAVVPRDNITYIGSTETDYHDDLDDVKVEQSDVDYLLDCVNGMFPTVKLEEKDITSSWAGLRPLIHEEGKPAAEMSRKDEIFESDAGLITIAGGKLTGYRKMAERILEYILKKGELVCQSSNSANMKLTGDNFKNRNNINQLIENLTNEYKSFDLPVETVSEYVHRYGMNTPTVFRIFKDLVIEESYRNKDDKQILIVAELIYTINHEMVVRLTDFFDRRTSYLLFDRKLISTILDDVCTKLAEEFGLSESDLEKEKQIFKYEYNKRLNFVPVSN